MKLFNLALVTALAITSGSAFAQTAPTAPTAAPTAPTATPTAAGGDSIVVLAKHTEAKPDDPVKVNFTKFKVTKATFDPKKIDGSKATIEIDATSLKSGIDKRDAHLNTADFLDTAKNATITIDIDGVKKKADKTYNANATVKFRGVTKKYPVTFDVVDTTADTVHVKGETTIQRTDFKVGKDPKDPKAGVQNDLTVQLDLHIKKV
ncbi:MAG TPA: YceI family protein [Kofleriaceae bacterium]